MDFSELTRKYLALRDRRAEVVDRHKQELAKYDQVLGDLENIFLEQLNDAGQQSFATDSATVYKGVHTSVKVADKEAFKEELNRRIKEGDDWSLLDMRPSKSLVSAMYDAGEEVPGVNISRTQYVRVNRKTK